MRINKKMCGAIIILGISSSVANAGWSKQEYYDSRIKDYTEQQNEILKYGTKGFVASCKAKKLKTLTKKEAETLLVISERGKVNGKYTCGVAWIDADVDTNGGFVKETIVMDCIDQTVKVIQGESGAMIHQSYNKKVKTCI